jgi:hypothetical protein
MLERIIEYVITYPWAAEPLACKFCIALRVIFRLRVR